MGNLTRLDLNETIAMSESDAVRMASEAKWRRRVFWMACGLFGAHLWGQLRLIGSWLIFSRVGPAWHYEFLWLSSILASMPLAWLLLSGRFEKVTSGFTRRPIFCRLFQLLIVSAIFANCAQSWILYQLQARNGQSLWPALQSSSLVLRLLWPVMLGLCLVRLAPGLLGRRNETELSATVLPTVSSVSSAFALEPNVTGWRQAMLAREGISAEQVRELEAHLRDMLVDLVRSGLPPAEAFPVALRRLGTPATLAAEFAKEEPVAKWRHRLFWMASALFGFHLLKNGLNFLAVAGQYWFANHHWSRSLEYHLLTGCLPELAALGVGWLFLRGKLESAVNRMASRLQTRWAVGALVITLQMAMMALFYFVHSYGRGRLLEPTASQLICGLFSLLWLPAWLILLAPQPRGLAHEQIGA